mgnify:CR=1 FL=1
MKAFQYKFQSILNLKEQEETNLKEEYGALKRAFHEAEKALEQLKDRKDGYISELNSDEGQGALDVNKAMLYRNYLTHLREQIAATKEIKEERKEEMNKGFERLVEKTKEKKMFEKLKEKHKETFMSEQLRNLQNELDDMAQGRFNHQKSQDGGR